MYRLELAKLKILKTYIKVNLSSSFIKFSKFFANTQILFIQNKDKSLFLYINY